MAYILLNQLKVYQLSVEFSDLAWKIYKGLGWQLKKIIGDQFITSIDSVGSNIAEGYGRYHYLDKIKFYYNARGSLFESKHWIDLLYRREIINREKYLQLVKKYKDIQIGLNSLINSTYKKKSE